MLRVCQPVPEDRRVRSRRRAGLQLADGDDPARRSSPARSCSGIGGKDIADRIIDRYDLEGGGAEAVKDIFSPAGGTERETIRFIGNGSCSWWRC